VTSVPHQQKAKDNEGTTKDKKRKAPMLQKNSTGAKITFNGYNIFEKGLTFAPIGCIL
jgi:hypothetical protein